MGLIRHRSLPSGIDQLAENPLDAAKALKEAPKIEAPQPLGVHNVRLNVRRGMSKAHTVHGASNFSMFGAPAEPAVPRRVTPFMAMMAAAAPVPTKPVPPSPAESDAMWVWESDVVDPDALVKPATEEGQAAQASLMWDWSWRRDDAAKRQERTIAPPCGSEYLWSWSPSHEEAMEMMWDWADGRAGDDPVDAEAY